ncbi:hypothetical protein UPYG_G00347400 [Umbra pygmaea]|uniref:Uncharacterized protein n=1 Tax=Umbra pygmaea TaxID=75934 RepID=A0ABD0VYJ7_UMBPY
MSPTVLSCAPVIVGKRTPESVGAGLGVGRGARVRGAHGGGGVTAVLPEPPFLQREKRLGRGDLISNSRCRAIATGVSPRSLVSLFGVSTVDFNGLVDAP